MPKLYYTATSCGAASFMAAHVAGVKIDTEQVDLKTHKTSSGADFYAINPKGNVPTLVLDDGTVLNEGSAVLQAIADMAPGKVAPENGTSGRYQVQEALNYTASEYHATVGHLFNPTIGPEVKAYFVDKVDKKLTYLNDTLLKGKKFVVGNSWTIADSYLYVCLSWSPYLGVDLAKYPAVKSYFDGIAALPAVVAAFARIAENPASTL